MHQGHIVFRGMPSEYWAARATRNLDGGVVSEIQLQGSGSGEQQGSLAPHKGQAAAGDGGAGSSSAGETAANGGALQQATQVASFAASAAHTAAAAAAAVQAGTDTAAGLSEAACNAGPSSSTGTPRHRRATSAVSDGSIASIAGGISAAQQAVGAGAVGATFPPPALQIPGSSALPITVGGPQADRGGGSLSSHASHAPHHARVGSDLPSLSSTPSLSGGLLQPHASLPTPSLAASQPLRPRNLPSPATSFNSTLLSWMPSSPSAAAAAGQGSEVGGSGAASTSATFMGRDSTRASADGSIAAAAAGPGARAPFSFSSISYPPGQQAPAPAVKPGPAVAASRAAMVADQWWRRRSGLDRAAAAAVAVAEEEEEREVGHVKGYVYKAYASSVGWVTVTLVLVTLLLMQVRQQQERARRERLTMVSA